MHIKKYSFSEEEAVSSMEAGYMRDGRVLYGTSAKIYTYNDVILQRNRARG